MAPPARNSKPIFKTSSPFTDTTWPSISHDDQEIILDLVCNLIAPLGSHRKTHIHPSKGKKRKRSFQQNHDTPKDPPPPVPEIGNHLLIGINSVTRHLESLAAKTAPASLAQETHGDGDDDAEVDAKRLSMVLITHPKPDASPAHAHFPTLLHLSTLKQDASSTESTRLIALPTASDARLASSLHIPRVGALGIFEGAPGAKTLEEYVREKVGRTECKWVDEAMAAEWRGMDVKNEGAALGVKKGKGKKQIEE